jgi:hypothetical protein
MTAPEERAMARRRPEQFASLDRTNTIWIGMVTGGDAISRRTEGTDGMTTDPAVQQWQDWMSVVRTDAQQTWESGRTFYVAKFNLGGTVAGFMSMNQSQGDDVAGALQTIEGIGWRLDSTGYVYQPLKERSHMITDSAQMTGNVVGIYTFRRQSESTLPPAP